MSDKASILPNYFIDFDENDELEGLDAISIVDKPAVKLPFLCFSETEKIKFKADEDKHIITGVAILADTPIYRFDDVRGEYTITFTTDVITRLITKMSKNNLFNSVNLQHNENAFVDGVYLIESYQKDDKRGIVPVEFADVPNGSWIVSYKVVGDELWNAIKNEGDLNGFSVQGFFDLIQRFADSKPLAQMSLTERIENAIEMHYQCALDYNSPLDAEGKETVLTYRGVTVVAWGLSMAGNEVIRAYQYEGNTLSGNQPTWRLFRVDRIAKLTPERKMPRNMLPYPLYDFATDKSMLQVYKIATYTPGQIERAEEGEENNRI